MFNWNDKRVRVIDDGGKEISRGTKVAICGDTDPERLVEIVGTIIEDNPPADDFSEGGEDADGNNYAVEGRTVEGMRMNIWVYARDGGDDGGSLWQTENVDVADGAFGTCPKCQQNPCTCPKPT